MRDFLEDADRHRDDGYGRAQAHVRQSLPRRFYKETGVVPVEGGYAATLDDRVPRTQGQKTVVVPTAALAREMAAEWAAQREEIDPETMPLVRLANTAVESGEERVPAFRDEILKYAGNDLLLYRADTPRELIAEQEKHWDAALVKLARHFGVSFQPTIGIMHQPQPGPTLEKLRNSLGGTTLFELVPLVSITGLTGSGLLTIALREGLMEPDAVWDAAHVDEDHNVRLWGAVEEATERREKRRRDFLAAIRMLELLRT
jgi:chaperone required for assembly of F1-ATPase